MRRRASIPLALAAVGLSLALPAPALAAQTLTVERAGLGTGTIASSPAGIACPSECQASFEDGATVTLTATPGPGSGLPAWTGCNVVFIAEGKCRVTMSAARSVTATFPLAQHTLTLTEAGEGAGTITSSPAGISCGTTCSASFTHGTLVTLTATPDSLSLTPQWSGCTHAVGSKCEVTMSEAESVTATFSRKPQFVEYPLDVEKGGTGEGTVLAPAVGISCGAVCSGRVRVGSQVTLTASPSPGSVFAHWSGGGCSGSAPCTTTIKRAETVKATFTLSGQRTLAVTKTGSGQGTVTARAAGIECGQTCSAQVPAGKKITLTAKAATGSTFAHWSGACSGTAKTCTVTMSEARSVVATFTGPPPTASKAPACLVPKLKGKTLARARSALSAAHCALGRVSKSKGAKGSLVVRSSSPAAGSTLAAGAKVDLKLRRAARTHKAHRR